jgi:hypothetical protein
MTRLASGGLLVLVLAGLLVAGFPSPADEPKAAPDETDFGNKVLCVRLGEHSAQAGHSIVLTRVRLKRLGDRWFLTGKEVYDADREAILKGPTHWLRLSDVESMGEYDTLEEYRKTLPGGVER